MWQFQLRWSNFFDNLKTIVLFFRWVPDPRYNRPKIVQTRLTTLIVLHKIIRIILRRLQNGSTITYSELRYKLKLKRIDYYIALICGWLGIKPWELGAVPEPEGRALICGYVNITMNDGREVKHRTLNKSKRIQGDVCIVFYTMYWNLFYFFNRSYHSAWFW